MLTSEKLRRDYTKHPQPDPYVSGSPLLLRSPGTTNDMVSQRIRVHPYGKLQNKTSAKNNQLKFPSRYAFQCFEGHENIYIQAIKTR
jgi:hypothetical protein